MRSRVRVRALMGKSRKHAEKAALGKVALSDEKRVARESESRSLTRTRVRVMQRHCARREAHTTKTRSWREDRRERKQHARERGRPVGGCTMRPSTRKKHEGCSNHDRDAEP